MRNLLQQIASSVFACVACVACVLLRPRISAAGEPPGQEPAKAAPATDATRVAIRPSWVHAFGPSSVSADGVGLGLALFPGKKAANGRLGLALVGSLYGPFSRADSFSPSAGPRTETLGFANVEIGYVVLARPGLTLELFDGTGAIGTRPVAIVDPLNRHFDFVSRLDFSVGAALKVPLVAGVALTLEGRDVLFVDQRESTQVSATAPRKLTMSEIAAALELPPGTVASRLRRAREVFADLAERARHASDEGGTR